MGGSFQEQLLKLGLVDKKKVDEAKKKQHQQRKEKSVQKQQTVDENKLLAEQAIARKKERARQLNQEREEKLKKREETARIRQMIESGRIAKDPGGVAYRFVDEKKIYRIFVSQEQVDLLEAGRSGIVRLGEEYEVCPVEVVKKIAEIDASVVVMLNEPKKKGSDEDDPYAGYEVPDDLVW